MGERVGDEAALAEDGERPEDPCRDTERSGADGDDRVRVGERQQVDQPAQSASSSASSASPSVAPP